MQWEQWKNTPVTWTVMLGCSVWYFLCWNYKLPLEHVAINYDRVLLNCCS